MKKFMFAAIAALALVSCKKDHTCVCEGTENGETSTESTIINGKRSEAKEQCDKKDEAAKQHAAQFPGTSASCSLK